MWTNFVIFYSLFLISLSQRTSILSNNNFEIYTSILKNPRDAEPECEGKCFDCSEKINAYKEEVHTSCDIVAPDNSTHNFCWNFYIMNRCYLQYANKYCIESEEYEEYEKFTNDIIEYFENTAMCAGNPANPC